MRDERLSFLKSILLPVLVAIYPVIFLFANNARITPTGSLAVPLLVVVLLGLLLFGFFVIVQRTPTRAGLSAVVLLIFFHTYGTVYSRLVVANKVQIEHYTLLPLVIYVALYAAFLVGKLNLQIARSIRDVLLLVVSALVLYNAALILPAEMEKSQAGVSARAIEPAGSAAAKSPDIYFIIFDEYAGFEALQQYWRYDGYQDFITYLEKKGFFVAEKSHSPTTDTLHEIASRLNFVSYPNPIDMKKADYGELFGAISDNKVMRLLKSYGYTTVVFDGPRILYRTKPQIAADYNMSYDDASSSDAGASGEDEFTSLFFGQTMVRIFPNVYIPQDTEDNPHRKMILYTLGKAPHLEEIPSPKFVYVHVMLPHMPMQFDEDGNSTSDKHRLDWTYYLPQHKYATKRAQLLVDEILQTADPDRPPVIILQSDHGARNSDDDAPESVALQNYDEKYKTSIMNTMMIPGYDYSKLPDDLSPIEPLKIVLNHYFNAGIEIVPASDEN